MTNMKTDRGDDAGAMPPQRVYDIKCRKWAIGDVRIEDAPQTPLFWSRLEITDDGMVHVIGKLTQEWRAAVISFPLVFVGFVVSGEILPPHMLLACMCFLACVCWIYPFILVFYEYKHFLIDPNQARAFYAEKKGVLYLELPNGNWLGVETHGKDKKIFLKVMQGLYGSRMLETMPKK